MHCTIGTNFILLCLANVCVGSVLPEGPEGIEGCTSTAPVRGLALLQKSTVGHKRPAVLGSHNESVETLQRHGTANTAYSTTGKLSVVHYAPNVWNDNVDILRSHNCYMYALNDIHRSNIEQCHEARLAATDSKALRKSCRPFFHIPGYYDQRNTLKSHAPVRHYKKSSITCSGIMRRISLDNRDAVTWKRADGEPLRNDDKCEGPAQYLAALVIDPGHDFHFYRRDHECLEANNAGRMCWSHKPGITPATRFDSAGKEIVDVSLAARRHGTTDGKVREYTDVCGYFCVSENGQLATRSDSFIHSAKLFAVNRLHQRSRR